MHNLTIESNGRIEKTAVYFNGEQLGGIKEIFLNLSEEGEFDAIISYLGDDNNLYTKNIFTDFLQNLKVVEPTLDEYEASMLQHLTIESDGEIENTTVLWNDEEQFGIINVLIHIKSGSQNTKGGLSSLFSRKKNIPEIPECKAEITFRNDDESIETEVVF